MKYLVFDTETTGLPAIGEPIEKQPYMLELGAVLVDDDLISILGELEAILRWDGLAIPEKATAVHGIGQARVAAEGKDPLQVMKSFDEMVRQADLICAFNLNFDELIALYSYTRVGGTGSAYKRRKKCCLLQSSRELCAVPYSTGVDTSKTGARRFKSPSLNEAYDILCQKGDGSAKARADDRHAALDDAKLALDVLQQLVWRNVPLIYERESLRPKPVVRDEDTTLLREAIFAYDEYGYDEYGEGNDRLNDWDHNFMADFSAKYEKYGSETFVSPAQRVHLLRIKRVLDGEG